jgi:hypothetical protein
MGIAVTQSKLENIYKEVLGNYQDHKEFSWKHRGGFVHYIQEAVTAGLLDSRFNKKHFRLWKLSYELDSMRDELLSDGTISALARNHLLKHDGKIIETPQYYWMRLAMTRALGTENPTRTALELYSTLSKQAQLPADHNYPANIFNNQRLLFDTTHKYPCATTLWRLAFRCCILIWAIRFLKATGNSLYPMLVSICQKRQTMRLRHEHG